MNESTKAKWFRKSFDPDSEIPFKVSRSKIDLYFECPLCFYLDSRIGIARPPSFPFALNSAVDRLLKKEFDIYRKSGESHPIMKEYGIDAIPIDHEKLDDWRNSFRGVQFLHERTNLIIFGAIDDLWQSSNGELIVVDYKSTSVNEKITSLDKDWHEGYKRQMEIYQWLIRQNDYKVSDTGYFLYCNGNTTRERFDARLEFDMTIIPYVGSNSWVENLVLDVKKCLSESTPPQPSSDCKYCAYRQATSDYNISNI
ncbi:MAG: PD-(D/E)XK nuclease family protein [Thermodesulfobacteriota bacterium]